jgi:hypothetical protein
MCDPASDRSEAQADMVGDLDALYDPVTILTVEVGDALDRSGLIFEDRDNAMENCDKVRDLVCDGKKSDFSFISTTSGQRGKSIVSLRFICKSKIVK